MTAAAAKSVARPAAAPKPAPGPKPAAAPKPAAFVTVACKIPTGLQLQLCEPETYVEEGLNGSRQRTRYSKVGPIFIVRGPAQPSGPVPRGYVRPTVVGGYALTSNVPADFFDEWMRQNAENPLVVNKMILAHGSRSHAVGLAREHKELTSGLQPVDPDGDARMPKPITDAVGAITIADEMAGRQPLQQEEAEAED